MNKRYINKRIKSALVMQWNVWLAGGSLHEQEIKVTKRIYSLEYIC